MTESEHHEIEDLRWRLSALFQRADLEGGSRELASEALEELTVVIEQLQSRNEELVVSQGALDEQTQRYRDLFETVADGYLITNAQGIIREANNPACELFGKRRSSVIGKPLATFVDRADRGAFYAQLDRIRGADAGGHLIVNLTVIDHDRIPTSLRATRTAPDGHGQFEIMWLLRDRRHDLVSEELRASEERLRTLFDSAAVGIVLCTVDGDTIFVNKLGTQLLDRHGGGRRLEAWLATVHPDDRGALEAAIHDACNSGEVSAVRHRIIHRDHTEVWVDHHIEPFHEAGTVTGFVSTLVDITVERTMVAELAASRDFTEALLDTAGALVVVVGPDGVVLRFNRACEQTTGFAAADVVGRPIVETVLPEDQVDQATAIVQELSTSTRHHLVRSFENDWLTTDGRRRRIAWTATVLTSSDGVRALIGTGHDITERRLLESRLAQVERLEAIGRMTAGVAHDFNNTLTTLRLRLDRLATRDLDATSHGDLVAAVETIDRTKHLIADLLSSSSAGSGDTEAVDLNAEIRRKVGVFDDLVGDRVVVDLDLTAAAAIAIIDPARFDQALVNLALNARDAMLDGGTLTISTSVRTLLPFIAHDPHLPAQLPPGDYVVVAVADTGTGIDPDVATQIFDPYYTTKPAGRGTGLGLYTTYGAITQADGAILVDSELGRGTTFSIWLPHATERPVPAAPTVLVVDDDDDLRQVLVEELARLGHPTEQAASSSSALGMIDRRFDVLICDVQLPDGNGGDVGTQFRQRHPRLAVVYITGAGTDALDALLPSDSIVVAKPFTTDDLVAAIAAARPKD